MKTQTIRGGFTLHYVEFTHCDSGRRCRVAAADYADAVQIAGELFDLHYGVRVGSCNSNDAAGDDVAAAFEDD